MQATNMMSLNTELGKGVYNQLPWAGQRHHMLYHPLLTYVHRADQPLLKEQGSQILQHKQGFSEIKLSPFF